MAAAAAFFLTISNHFHLCKSKQELQKPFFAQFLESQANKAHLLPPIITGKLVDDPGNVTQKFPSDNDEEWEF